MGFSGLKKLEPGKLKIGMKKYQEHEHRREASALLERMAKRGGPGWGHFCVVIKGRCCQEMKGEYLRKLNTEN